MKALALFTASCFMFLGLAAHADCNHQDGCNNGTDYTPSTTLAISQDCFGQIIKQVQQACFQVYGQWRPGSPMPVPPCGFLGANDAQTTVFANDNVDSARIGISFPHLSLSYEADVTQELECVFTVHSIPSHD